MRPKRQVKADHDDLFCARLDQIVNMKLALVALANRIDWVWLDDHLAGYFSGEGRPAESVRFMIGMLILKHTYALSDEQLWDRWVHNPYFQYFIGEVFFRHELPHERSGTRHWRERVDDHLGLVTVFFMQGSQFILSPLYAIPDFHTPLFIGLFHRAWRDGGDPRAVVITAQNQLATGDWLARFEDQMRDAYEPVMGRLLEQANIDRKWLGGIAGWSLPEDVRQRYFTGSKDTAGERIVGFRRPHCLTDTARSVLVANTLDTLINDRANRSPAIQTIVNAFAAFG